MSAMNMKASSFVSSAVAWNSLVPPGRDLEHREQGNDGGQHEVLSQVHQRFL